MSRFTDFTGLLGLGFAMATIVVALPFTREWPRLWRGLAWVSVLILVLSPIGALSAAFCVRGAVGDLSITTLVLLGSFVVRSVGGLPLWDERGRFVTLGLIVTGAGCLYPMALGVGMYDPYRLGYGAPEFVGGLIAVALAAWFLRLETLALCLGLALLAWAGRWYESTNLWDYVLDPLVSFYALGAVLCGGGRWLWLWRQRRRA